MKKRSDPKSTSKPPETIRLVLDETIAGHTILQGLRERGLPVVSLTEFVARGATDADVIGSLAGHADAYLITRDRHFRYHPAIKEKLEAGGVGAFVITSAGNKTAAQIVDIVAIAWPHIRAFVAQNQRPFAAKIMAMGKIERHI